MINNALIRRSIVLLGLAASAMPATSQAGTIVGGSAILTSGDELQLESWLGEGSLTLTNIFTKTGGRLPRTLLPRQTAWGRHSR